MIPSNFITKKIVYDKENFFFKFEVCLNYDIKDILVIFTAFENIVQGKASSQHL